MTKYLHFIRHILLIFLMGAFFYSGAQVTQFDWPSSAEESDKYDVEVSYEGTEYDMYTHISEPNLNVDPLYPDETDGVTGIFEDRSLSYVQFDFEGAITVEVTKLYGSAASRVEIQPKALGIEPHYFDGTTVRFQLSHHATLPSYVHVHFISDDNVDSDGEGGEHIMNAMMIFGNKPEENKPDKSGDGVVVYSESADLTNADLIYFEPGDYDLTTRFTDTGEVGQLPYTKTGQKVYLEGGAMVRGAFHGKDFDDIWLYGRGIVTGRDLAWHWFRDDAGEKDAFINFQTSDAPYIEGIIIDNPTHHTIPSGVNSEIHRLKIIGWASNHDGIRPKTGSVVEQIFIKTSDDYDYARDPHVVSNSIMWPAHNGAVGMLGWNDLGTGGAEYHNIAFINSETRQLDKKNSGIVGSMADDGIQLADNVYEDLYIEGKHAFLVNAILETVNGGASGYLNDFMFKNIRTEYPFMLTNGTSAKQNMQGVPNNWIEGWTFTNLVVAGELVTWENYQDYFDLDLTGSNGANEDASNYVRDVTFTSEGEIHEITVSTNTGGAVYPNGNAGVVQCLDGMGQMLNIVPDAGYRIDDVVVDGVSQGRIQTVLMDDVVADHTVTVTFESGDDYYDNEVINTPSDIDDLVATVVSCTSVDLTWSDVQFEDEYRIRRQELDSEGNILVTYVNLTDVPAGTTSYTDNTAIEGSIYQYMVRPLVDNTAVALSNTPIITIPACALPDIEDLVVTIQSCSTVDLEWGDIDGEDEYRVRRQELDSEGNILVTYVNLTDVPAGTTSYTDDAAIEGSIYQYMVRPLVDNTAVALSNTPIVTIPACTLPDIEDLVVTVQSCSTVDLEWGDIDGEDEYRVRRQELDSEGNILVTYVNLTDVPAGTTSYTDDAAIEGSIYQYMVRPLVDNTAVALSNTPIVTIPLCQEEEMSCNSNIALFPYAEGFEAYVGWSQFTDDDGDWTRDSNGTPTGSTGPSAASEGSYYLYLEASNRGLGAIGTNATAILESPCFDLSSANSATFSFQNHMYGSGIGSLALDITMDDLTWTNLWTQSGDQGNVWNTVNIDLSSYVGNTIKLRLTGTTGSSFRSDLAIDDFSLTVDGSNASRIVSDYNSSEEELNQKTMVYPNPTYIDRINIVSPTEFNSYKVFDISGQLILSSVIEGSAIELKAMEPGIYSIELYAKGIVEKIRFIKK